jgi:hypothetical protein
VAYVYAYPGPPFNWLGNFSLTQWQAFQKWYNGKPSGRWAGIELHYRIRAQQLRKTAGALEQFYQTVNDDTLSPTFNKTPWQPPQSGWFPYIQRDDQLPMVAMSSIKAYLKDQLQRQDDSVFHMNHLRNLIEKTEDKAQNAYQAITQNPQNWQTVSDIITQISGYFNLPRYSVVLVNDQTNVYPAGSSNPTYRVKQLDAPTQFEQEQMGRVAQPGDPVALKEEPQPQS